MDNFSSSFARIGMTLQLAYKLSMDLKKVFGPLRHSKVEQDTTNSLLKNNSVSTTTANMYEIYLKHRNNSCPELLPVLDDGISPNNSW